MPKLTTMSSITKYIQESYQELLTKVTWPTWKELQSSSVLVFVASLVIAFIVLGMDFIFGASMEKDPIFKGLVGILLRGF